MLRSFFRPAPQRAARSVAPRLEQLEDRNLMSTYTVTNTSGGTSTVGSLPWAVQNANYTSPAQLNFITFDIPGSGVHEIVLSNTLYIENQTWILGETQPGFDGTPLISVQGNGSVGSIFDMTAYPTDNETSAGSVIQYLNLFNASNDIVTIFSNTNTILIQYNYIGFYPNPNTGVTYLNDSASGTAAGIAIQSSYNTIRGNTISGVANAIEIGEDPAGSTPYSGNTYIYNYISGNYLGTDPTGSTAVGYGNVGDGILLGNGAQANYFGPYNVVSGNQVHGVELIGGDASGNVIFLNRFGTNAAGTAGIGDGDGILVAYGTIGNTIGGPLGGNLISDYTTVGISLGLGGYGAAYDNYVQGNIIGLDIAQNASLGGGEEGIAITNGSSGNTILGNVVTSTNNPVIVLNSYSNTIEGNWLGESAYGYYFSNTYYGVYLASNADSNYVLYNAYGSNLYGPYYVTPGDVGNIIA